jgi:3-isopropylmalate/(R)-2-methylmalate dehydratase small subunit
MKGRVHKLGDDINTDYIIAGKNKRDTYDPQVMAKHLFEDLDPTLYPRIKKGDIIVAGKNFGCGSSREAAPSVIQAAGISAIIAKSFGRIFFRNAINIGLPVLECDTSGIEDGDELEVDFSKGVIINHRKRTTLPAKKPPQAILSILREGGLVNYLRNHICNKGASTP